MQLEVSFPAAAVRERERERERNESRETRALRGKPSRGLHPGLAAYNEMETWLGDDEDDGLRVLDEEYEEVIDRQRHHRCGSVTAKWAMLLA